MHLLDMSQRRQSGDGLPRLLLRDPQFIEALQIEPKLTGCPEEMCESKRCITCDSPPPVQDSGYTISRDIELPRKFSSAHAEFFQFFGWMVSWVNRSDGHDGLS